ncbi:hypothetical protein [Pseudoalteromonas sp. ASV78]|uniref:hypothetical protein n=1 Tax=Pseudoalteromonas sp. ASV78 TaxID=3397851 RepID=UPI0039FCB352
MKLKVLFAVLILSSNTAFAAHTCEGKITTVDIRDNGALQISVDTIGSSNFFCNITNKSGTIGADTCKAMYSMALTAFMASKKVTLWFNKDDNTVCKKGDWTNLQEHGFYYLRMSN